MGPFSWSWDSKWCLFSTLDLPKGIDGDHKVNSRQFREISRKWMTLAYFNLKKKHLGWKWRQVTWWKTWEFSLQIEILRKITRHKCKFRVNSQILGKLSILWAQILFEFVRNSAFYFWSFPKSKFRVTLSPNFIWVRRNSTLKLEPTVTCKL